jgi:hypothetical protein
LGQWIKIKIVQPGELLGLTRSSFYYQTVAPSAAKLTRLRLIDQNW